MRHTPSKVILVAATAAWLCSCAESSETKHDDDAGTDLDVDSDVDADTDADSDSDTDSDTDEIDAGPPDGGAACADPIEIPADQLEWDFLSDWVFFNEDALDMTAMAECHEAEGNEAWFKVLVPNGYTISVKLNNGGLFWANFITGCDAAACETSDLASQTNVPRWQNVSGADQEIYIVFESNILISSGDLDCTFSRYEMNGEDCPGAYVMDEATTATPQSVVMAIDGYQYDTLPTSCQSQSGIDIWFDLVIPPSTKATFTGSIPTYYGSTYYGYSLDCESCIYSTYSYLYDTDGVSEVTFDYRNSTDATVHLHTYLQTDTETTAGNATATLALEALPAGDTCGNAIAATPLPYAWSDASTLFLHDCDTALCSTTVGPDVWFAVTVPAGQVLRVEKTAGTANSFIAAATGTCGALTKIDLVQAPGDPEILVWHNTGASDVAVHIVAGLVAAGTLATTQFEISAAPPVPGDFCTSAIEITQGDTAAKTGEWATFGDYFWGGDGCAEADGVDVWFEVPVPHTSGQRLRVTESENEDDIGMSVKSACADVACVVSSTGSGELLYLNTTDSDDQIVYVALEPLTDSPTSSDYSVSFAWETPPQGDLCASDRIPIDTTADSDAEWTGDWTTFMDTATMTDPTCEVANGKDVWFDVTIGAGEQLVVSDVAYDAETRLHVVDACGSDEICSFSSATGQLVWNNDTGADATIIVAIEALDATAISGPIDVSFVAQDIPAYSSCSTAFLANASPAATNDVRNLQSFSSTWPNGVCADASGNAVWYEVAVPNGQAVKVQETYSLDTVVYLADSCPVTDTCINSSDTPELVAWYNATGSEATIYAVTRGATATTGLVKTNISFDTDVILGSYCSYPISKDLTSTATSTWTGNLSAFENTFTGGTGCAGVAGPDIWFAVTVPASNWLNVYDSGTVAIAIQALDGCSSNECAQSSGNAIWWHNTSASSKTVYILVEGDDVTSGVLNLTFHRQTTPPEVTLGDGTYTSSYLPMYQYYGYSYSQTIYNASDLYAGQIKKISWYYNGYSAISETFSIYMGNTSKTTFSSTSDYVPVSGMTLVYTTPTGGLTFPATAGWFAITLDAGFNYNGTQNLVVAVDRNTGSWTSGPGFYATAATTSRSVSYFQDSIDITPASPTSATSQYTVMYYPNVRFNY
jgi:hypothetical protein